MNGIFMGDMAGSHHQPHGASDLLRELGGGEPGTPPGERANEAWRQLVDRYGPYVWSICWRILGDHELCEEAAQELWLRVRAKAHQFTGSDHDREASARSWLAHLAATCALQLLRRQRRERKRRSTLSMEPIADPPQSADDDGLRQAVREALDALPEGDSTILSLRFIAGCDYDAVGCSLGCSPAAARVRVHRALKRLRSCLARAGIALGADAAIIGQPGFDAVFAGAVPPPPVEVLAHWHGLLSSSLQPAASFAASPTGLTVMAKLSLAAGAIAIAALLGSTLVRSEAVESTTATPTPPADAAATPPHPTTTVLTQTLTILNDGTVVDSSAGEHVTVGVVGNGKVIRIAANGPAIDVNAAAIPGQAGKGAHVERTWLGAETDEVSLTLDHQLHLAENSGLQVETVLPDSPAAAAGLKTYDVLTHLDDHLLTDPDQLEALLDTYPADRTVAIRLLRDGKEMTLNATLKRHLEDAARRDRILSPDLQRQLQKRAERLMHAHPNAAQVPASAKPAGDNQF